MPGELILVTGGSGFIGAHCLARLLREGYRVRTSLRSLVLEEDARAMLKEAGVEPGDRLSFVEANLLSDSGWKEAVAGCDYILHIASPFPPVQPKNENELIVPARDGALRVLKSARDAGVKRVVMTSSFAAIGYGHKKMDRAYTEEDWSDLRGIDVTPYIKSKTLAERAAWDFIQKEGGDLELAVINPVSVYGPVLGPDYSSSINILRALLTGAIATLPNLYFSVVDARDVADLHVRAMTNPVAKGQRFLAASGESISIPQIALTLKNSLGEAGARVSTKVMSDWVIKLTSIIDRSLKDIVPDLSKVKKVSAEKAKSLLGWEPRSSDEAICAAGESLVRLGLLSPRP